MGHPPINSCDHVFGAVSQKEKESQIGFLLLSFPLLRDDLVLLAVPANGLLSGFHTCSLFTVFQVLELRERIWNFGVD